jgi:hypothetical protein
MRALMAYIAKLPEPAKPTSTDRPASSRGATYRVKLPIQRVLGDVTEWLKGLAVPSTPAHLRGQDVSMAGRKTYQRAF